MPRDVGPIGSNPNANMPKMQAGVTSGYDRKGNGGNGKDKGRDEEPEPQDEEEDEEAHLDNDTFAGRRGKVNTETFMNERMPWEQAEEERKRKLEEFNRKRAAMKGGKGVPQRPINKQEDKPAYEVRALGRQVEGGFDATSAVNSTLSAYNQLRERQQEQAKEQAASKPAPLDPGAAQQNIKFEPLTPAHERKPVPGQHDKFASWQSADNTAPPAPRPGTGPLQRPAQGAQGAQPPARPAAPQPRPGTGPLNANPAARTSSGSLQKPAGEKPVAPRPKPPEAPARAASERPAPRGPLSQGERPEAIKPIKPVEHPVVERIVPAAPEVAAAPEPVAPVAPPAPVAPVAPAAPEFGCQYLIVDTFTGYGVPGARLEFEPISNDLLPVVNGTADTKGWYRTKDVPPGEYQLTVRYPGYIPEAITVNIVAGQMDEGQILLKRP